MNWKELLTRQIRLNQFTNLLAPETTTCFVFTEETKQLILALNKEKPVELNGPWLDHMVNEVLASFYQLNPYYYFSRKATADLRALYEVLLDDIRQEDNHRIDFTQLAKRHYNRLGQWLRKADPAALRIYPANSPTVEKKVVYSRYGATRQLDVLGIRPGKLEEPILDIGCGKEHNLVLELRSRGLEAYGIDREAVNSSVVFNADWLAFHYAPGTWGTIISHLGFASHFIHQHLLGTGLHLQFASSYRQILQSLKKKGSFYYAPDLPFVETYIDPNQFLISKKEIAGTSYKTTRITRVS